MALGNSASMGQARGKNKAVIVKRRADERFASSFYSLSGSTVETGNSEACALGSTPNTYYHNAGAAGGYTTGTYVYTSRRAYDKHYLPNGYYKVSHDGSTFKSIQISSGQIASTPSTCR